jgi:5-methylcytosine-specific restriction endonuclease McrBC GTP-binding regulatory subunit McrB
MLSEIFNKIEKTNQQRATMAMVLVTIMKQSEQASLSLRTSIAANFMDMLDKSMIEEDDGLVKFINEGIDYVSAEAKEAGVDDLRTTLKGIIQRANETIEQRDSRVKEANSILSQINFDNNINLN